MVVTSVRWVVRGVRSSVVLVAALALLGMSCNGEVLSVTVAPDRLWLALGDTAQVSAQVVATGAASRAVRWSSTSEAVATVDADGLVTAVAEGITEIVATSSFDDGLRASIDVTVVAEPAVLSVRIDQGDQLLIVGEEASLSVTVVAVWGVSEAVVWSSDEPAVASVDSSGVVTALSIGMTTVTAASAFDPSMRASVEVLVEPDPAELELCGAIEEDRTLSLVTHPYVICERGAGVSGAVLTIEPGVTVVSRGGVLGVSRAFTDINNRFYPAGTIIAIGTEEAPIRLVGAVAEPGSWNGLAIGSAKENRLSHVEVAYGGARNGYNLTLGHGARVEITDSVFRDASGNGMGLDSNTVALPGFARNEFRSNAGVPFRLYPHQMRYMDAASVFEGNGLDVIEVRSGTLSGPASHVWPKTSVPFHLTGSINVDTDLGIEPGFQLLASGSWIRVRTLGGSVVAVGTPDAPIRFTGRPAEAGAWSGLQIDSAAAENEFAFVEIAHGGGARGHHNLTLTGSVAVTNSTIRDSAACGIFVARHATLSHSGNTFYGNAAGDVCP